MKRLWRLLVVVALVLVPFVNWTSTQPVYADDTTPITIYIAQVSSYDGRLYQPQAGWATARVYVHENDTTYEGNVDALGFWVTPVAFPITWHYDFTTWVNGSVYQKTCYSNCSGANKLVGTYMGQDARWYAKDILGLGCEWYWQSNPGQKYPCEITWKDTQWPEYWIRYLEGDGLSVWVGAYNDAFHYVYADLNYLHIPPNATCSYETSKAHQFIYMNSAITYGQELLVSCTP